MVALGMSAALVLACQGAPASLSPSPSQAPSGSATAPVTPSPTGSGVASASPIASSTGASGPWQAAGSIPITDLDALRAVVLADGRVLVVGTAFHSAGTDTPTTSPGAALYDPTTSTWRTTTPLNLPRYDFAMVTLQDGRVLVTGGLTGPGLGGGGSLQSRLQSFSSTYLFDPGAGKETWTKVGLLNTARTGPAAALLSDGRVLVAGGYYRDDPGSSGDLSNGIVQADVIPDVTGRALATVEVFDPATGRWTQTGSLHYARFDAQAVTLGDGRVLIVGSADGPNGGVSGVASAAYTSAELYDPKTGRFSLTAALPALPRAAFAKLGLVLPDGDPTIDSPGSLVALPDGGAMLIGQSASWKHQGEITRSFRYAVGTGRWTEIDQAWALVNENTGIWSGTGWARWGANAAVVSLKGGDILVAGGYDEQDAPTVRATLYDPASTDLTGLTNMPDARQGSVAVALPDGSALVLGGWRATTDGGSEFTTSALRYVPSP
jgi:Galactose oxidase, central domain